MFSIVGGKRDGRAALNLSPCVWSGCFFEARSCFFEAPTCFFEAPPRKPGRAPQNRKAYKGHSERGRERRALPISQTIWSTKKRGLAVGLLERRGRHTSAAASLWPRRAAPHKSGRRRRARPLPAAPSASTRGSHLTGCHRRRCGLFASAADSAPDSHRRPLLGRAPASGPPRSDARHRRRGLVCVCARATQNPSSQAPDARSSAGAQTVSWREGAHVARRTLAPGDARASDRPRHGAGASAARRAARRAEQGRKRSRGPPIVFPLCPNAGPPRALAVAPTSWAPTRAAGRARRGGCRDRSVHRERAEREGALATPLERLFFFLRRRTTGPAAGPARSKRRREARVPPLQGRWCRCTRRRCHSERPWWRRVGQESGGGGQKRPPPEARARRRRDGLAKALPPGRRVRLGRSLRPPARRSRCRAWIQPARGIGKRQACFYTTLFFGGSGDAHRAARRASVGAAGLRARGPRPGPDSATPRKVTSRAVEATK